MEFMVFKFNNGSFLSGYVEVSDNGFDSIGVTEDIHKAYIFTPSEYASVYAYFDVLAGTFTKFKITEV